MAKRVLTVVLLVVVAVAALRLTVFRHFDGEAWKAMAANPELHACDGRQRMVLDLVLFHRLKGLSRQELIDLLGDAAPSPEVPGYDVFFSLGVQPFSLQRAYLAFRFSDDRVSGFGWVKTSK